MRESRLLLSLAAAGLVAGPSCSPPDSRIESRGIDAVCLEAIAGIALANPRLNSLPANLAGPIGLTPSSDPNAPPYLSRQAEFRASDGSTHYFAVDSVRWTKAALIRLVPTSGEPRSFFYVVDRNAALVSAARVNRQELTVDDIGSARVLERFRREIVLWAAAGPADKCRSGAP